MEVIELKDILKATPGLSPDDPFFLELAKDIQDGRLHIGFVHTFFLTKIQQGRDVEAVLMINVLEKFLAESQYRSLVNNGMSWACKYGSAALASVLMDRGTPPDGLNRMDAMPTPLSTACAYGQELLVKLLLERHADMEFRDLQGKTPLTHACVFGHLSVVKILIQHGCSLESRDIRRRTALMFALLYGRAEVAKFLLASGADKNAEDAFFHKPEHYADMSEDPRKMKELLRTHPVAGR